MNTRRALLGTFTSFATALLASSSHAQVGQWPTDPQWVSIQRASQTLGDADDDENNARLNIVGDAARPAMYVFRDATHWFWRIRLDGDPRQGGGFSSFGWGCELDIDGDPTDYEFISAVDGIGATDTVEWRRNDTPSMAGDPAVTATRLLVQLDAADYARVVDAGIDFPVAAPDQDFFLDWAIPISDLQNPPLVNPVLPEDVVNLAASYRMLCGSSVNGQALTNDLSGVGTTIDELNSDPFTCSAGGCSFCNVASACGDLCQPCGPNAPRCDLVTLTCSACIADTDCGGGAPLCAPSGACGECLSDAECMGDTPSCNLATNVCECSGGPAYCTDTDGDGLSDGFELEIGTRPDDADSDDDGVLDGDEPEYDVDTDGDGVINALDPDSDDDLILDGTELGTDCSHPHTSLLGGCVPDGDGGAMTTDPLDPDTDGGGVSDGQEDADHNGAIDIGETDPNDPTDDVLPCEGEDCDPPTGGSGGVGGSGGGDPTGGTSSGGAPLAPEVVPSGNGLLCAARPPSSCDDGRWAGGALFLAFAVAFYRRKRLRAGGRALRDPPSENG